MINKINFNQTYNTRYIPKKVNNLNISFKANSVEISNSNSNSSSKDKFKYLGLILGCILAFIAGTQASVILEGFGYKIGLCNRGK